MLRLAYRAESPYQKRQPHESAAFFADVFRFYVMSAFTTTTESNLNSDHIFSVSQSQLSIY